MRHGAVASSLLAMTLLVLVLVSLSLLTAVLVSLCREVVADGYGRRAPLRPHPELDPRSCLR
jgi:hypothetical protein